MSRYNYNEMIIPKGKIEKKLNLTKLLPPELE